MTAEAVSAPRRDLLEALLHRQIQSLLITADGQQQADPQLTGLILPGSFNPLHIGHLEMAAIARQLTGKPLTFELAVRNVDKPVLDRPIIERRLEQFAGKYPIVVTLAPTFREKSDLFPGCTFVIGVDTAERLVHLRYYGDSQTAMLAALAHIRQQGNRFLVAGRLADGQFKTLADVTIPPGFADLFQPIPDTLFRRDISSTEIRARRAMTPAEVSTADSGDDIIE